jgi:hypothetical protein
VLCALQVSGVLSADNRDLSLRFKHSCDARHRVEKKLKALEAEVLAARPAEPQVGWAR